jgi:hypothetical protein
MVTVRAMKRATMVAAATMLTALLWSAAPNASIAADRHTTAATGFCVKVYAWVGPKHHSHVGEPIYWFSTWENCGRSIYIKAISIARGPCGPLGRTEFHVRIPLGGATYIVSPKFPACQGTYRVTTKAFRRGVRLDRASHYFHVKP